MHAMRHSGFAAVRRGGVVLAALALLGLAGCVAYPADYYGYGGGYYAPAPAYAYAPPVVGPVYIGGGCCWGGWGGWHGHWR
jgi:hypothetical protein